MVIKKSRFICWLDYAEGRDDMKNLLAEAREQHPAASHHCWAFSCFNGRDEGQGDDGEPKGTAGWPILTVLQHAGVSNISAVVIRYFGGTKLGTGGLARAYADAVKEALETLPTAFYSPRISLSVSADFAQEAQLRYIAAQAGADISVLYDSGIQVIFELNEDQRDFVIEHIGRDFPQLEVAILER